VTRTELTQAIIWLDQVAAKAKEESAKLRSDLAVDARAEFVEQGTAPTWRIPDVATITASVTHESVGVADDAAFVSWVAVRYPTEVETVTVVRPAWRAYLLTQAVVNGEVACLPDTGEVVPGLSVRAGGDFAGIAIRATAAAKAAFGAVAGEALRQMALVAGPAVPVVLAELEAADAHP